MPSLAVAEDSDSILERSDVMRRKVKEKAAQALDKLVQTLTAEEAERGQLFPLTISADLPLYLVRPRPNFDRPVLEQLGLWERAERHGVTDRLASANLLPHGGGYRYPHFAGVAGVHEDGPDARRFEMRRTDGSTQIISDPRAESFGYRGLEILGRMEELGLSEVRRPLQAGSTRVDACLAIVQLSMMNIK